MGSMKRAALVRGQISIFISVSFGNWKKVHSGLDLPQSPKLSFTRCLSGSAALSAKGAEMW